jgi:hypothetical protein
MQQVLWPVQAAVNPLLVYAHSTHTLLVCSAVQLENIGARRLHTVLERLVEDISFEAPDLVQAALAAAEAGADEQQRSSTATAQREGSDSTATESEGPVSQPFQIDVEQCLKEAREWDDRPLGEKLQFYAEDQEAFHEGYQVTHVVDKQQVREKLQSLLKQDDLSKYIL